MKPSSFETRATRSFQSFIVIVIVSAFFMASCASKSKTSEASERPALQAKSSSENDVASSPRKPIQFSETCQDWKSVSVDEAIRSGFYKREGTTVFVDQTLKAFVTLEGKSAPFFSEASKAEWTFTATASGFNSIQNERSLGSPMPKPFLTLRDLISASEEQTAQTKDSNRWIVILLENETKVAVVLQGDLCAAAPQARYVTCSTSNLECSFFPKSFEIENEDRVARACLSDLKMGLPEKVQPLVKACEYFQSSEYEEFQRKLVVESTRCGERALRSAKSLPKLKRVEAACAQIPSSLLELTGAR